MEASRKSDTNAIRKPEDGSATLRFSSRKKDRHAFCERSCRPDASQNAMMKAYLLQPTAEDPFRSFTMEENQEEHKENEQCIDGEQRVETNF